MSSKFLMRDFPDLDPDMVAPPKSGRIAVVLFIATHGLWLILSLAGLLLSVSDAMPSSGDVLVASRSER